MSPWMQVLLLCVFAWIDALVLAAATPVRGGPDVQLNPRNISVSHDLHPMREIKCDDQVRFMPGNGYMAAQGIKYIRGWPAAKFHVRAPKESPQRLYCFRGDQIWLTNQWAHSFQWTTSEIAEAAEEVVRYCCGDDCMDTGSLNFKHVAGTINLRNGVSISVGRTYQGDRC